jgi:hypothetical protein
MMGVSLSLFVDFFSGISVPFSTRGVQSSKTPQETFWKEIMSKTFYKKVEGGKAFFPAISPFGFFLSRFWPFLCTRKPKNTIKIVSKIRPENLEKSQKR